MLLNQGNLFLKSPTLVELSYCVCQGNPAVSKVLRLISRTSENRGANQSLPVFQFPATASCSRPHPAIRRFPAATRGLGVEGCDIEPTDNQEAALRSTCLSAGHCHLSLSDRQQPPPTEAPTYRGDIQTERSTLFLLRLFPMRLSSR